MTDEQTEGLMPDEIWAYTYEEVLDYTDNDEAILGPIEHDGFKGDVIGHYVTREGKRGVVLQQEGTPFTGGGRYERLWKCLSEFFSNEIEIAEEFEQGKRNPLRAD